MALTKDTELFHEWSLLIMLIYFLWIHDQVLTSTIYRKVFWIRHSLFTYTHTHTHTSIYQKGKALQFSVPYNWPKCSSYLLIIRRKVNLPRVTEHKEKHGLLMTLLNCWANVGNILCSYMWKYIYACIYTRQWFNGSLHCIFHNFQVFHSKLT